MLALSGEYVGELRLLAGSAQQDCMPSLAHVKLVIRTLTLSHLDQQQLYGVTSVNRILSSPDNLAA